MVDMIRMTHMMRMMHMMCMMHMMRMMRVMHIMHITDIERPFSSSLELAIFMRQQETMIFALNVVRRYPDCLVNGRLSI